MSLLEKVRLVKKKEEKLEEEPPAEERKPREDWGHQGRDGWARQPCAYRASGYKTGPRSSTRDG